VVVGIGYGFPGADMWDAANAGRLRIGGCIIDGRDEWSDRWHCWPCSDQEWIEEHTAREHRAGRTTYDCADDGLLWDPDTDVNAVRLGMAKDLDRRFRPPGFVDRLWPYLRDVPDGGVAWRPNSERIAALLDVQDSDGRDGRRGTVGEPDRITDEDLDRVGLTELATTAGPRQDDAGNTIAWFHEHAEDLTGRLGAIPSDVDLHTLDTVAYEQTVGVKSYSQRLVDLIAEANPWSRSLATEIAARKRPLLLVARDRLVDAALGIPEDRQIWRPWWRTVTVDPRLIERLERIRSDVEAPDLPLLRIAWLSVWTREHDALEAGGPSPSERLPAARGPQSTFASRLASFHGTVTQVTRVPERTAPDERANGGVSVKGGEPRKLFDVAVIEQVHTSRPRCARRVEIEQGADGPMLALSRRKQQLTLDDDRREQPQRLPLVTEPVPGPRGLGVTVSVEWDGEVEELLIRPVVLADAAWLSEHRFECRLELPMVEALARHDALSPFSGTHESMVLLGYPRMAPHALGYRIGPEGDRQTWYRADGRWVAENATWRFREIERLSSTIDELRARPWSKRHPLPDLLFKDAPLQQVQPWAFDDALERIGRPAHPHEELMGLLMCSPQDATIDAAALGEDLARHVNALDDRVNEAAKAQLEEFLAHLQEYEEDEGVEWGEWEPDEDDRAEDGLSDDAIMAIHRLSRPGFSTTVRELFWVLRSVEAFTDR
jgi:hypothetical protein